MSGVEAFCVHLESGKARFSGAILVDFGDPEGERAALAASVTLHVCWGDALLRVSGADAQAFLQGQLSNDVGELDGARGQLTSWCTPQGRVLATFVAWREQDDYVLQLPLELAQPVRARLERFILRSRVKIADASAERIVFGIGGPGAAARLARASPALPAAPMQMVDAGGGAKAAMLRPDLYQLVVPLELAQRWWDVLAEQARPCGASGWHWRRVQACLPVVTAATQDRFVPQMLDLERVGAVSFTKGCYPGQEIVARAQYRGEVKRRLFRVHAATEAMQVAQDVMVEGRAAGSIVNCARAPSGGSAALAVLQVEAAERSDLALAGTQHPVVVDGACH